MATGLCFRMLRAEAGVLEASPMATAVA
jgi:hypothetical protein